MLTVKLSHAANPDIRGVGYWDDGIPEAPMGEVSVLSYQDASAVCKAYIEENGLGGGNWTGGEIKADGVPVAWVSYNGRVWDVNDQEIVVK